MKRHPCATCGRKRTKKSLDGVGYPKVIEACPGRCAWIASAVFEAVQATPLLAGLFNSDEVMRNHGRALRLLEHRRVLANLR